jgi:hypothetical protein
MLLRTYALYGGNIFLLVCLLVLLGCQLGSMAFFLHGGQREHLA